MVSLTYGKVALTFPPGGLLSNAKFDQDCCTHTQRWYSVLHTRNRIDVTTCTVATKLKVNTSRLWLIHTVEGQIDTTRPVQLMRIKMVVKNPM